MLIPTQFIGPGHGPQPPKIVVACGSIRSSHRHQESILDLARTSGDIDDFIEAGREALSRGIALSNSEILAAAAINGVFRQGGQAIYLSLKDLFAPRESPVVRIRPGYDLEEFACLDTLSLLDGTQENLARLFADAHGVVLSTPVYFGDRSSVANKLIQLASKFGYLGGKAFGATSVGAKRNGGQETCNIYSLMEAMLHDAVGVGNGPPTAQYGGTAVGGNKGHVLDDSWGLTSSRDTGSRVAHAARLLVTGDSAEDAPTPVRVTIINAIDTDDGFLQGYLHALAQRVQEHLPWVSFEFFHATRYTIFRCLGCTVCPKPGDAGSAATCCAIRDPEDSMERVRELLASSDAAIVAGLNSTDTHRLNFRYQVLTERMRYMRRSHFELTDMLFAGLCYHQFGATINAILTTKILTSYIRHNTIFHRPIEILEHQGAVLRDGFDDLAQFCRTAQRIKRGKALTPGQQPRYEAHGEVAGYKP
ncbi:flavodoxin family protein [Solidesulfovibrio sp.]